MQILKTILLVLLVTATVLMILRSNAAIDFHEKYLEGPEANKIVEFHGIRMSQGDFVLHYIVEQQVSPLATALVQQEPTTLWSLLYALYGTLGNYLYYLMRLARSEKARSPGLKAADSQENRYSSRQFFILSQGRSREPPILGFSVQTSLRHAPSAAY